MPICHLTKYHPPYIYQASMFYFFFKVPIYLLKALHAEADFFSGSETIHITRHYQWQAGPCKQGFEKVN